MDNRVLTKRHIFTYEMKYKETFLSRYNEEISYHRPEFKSDDEFTLRFLDRLVLVISFTLDSYKDEEVFEFLSDFKDIIDWKDYFLEMIMGDVSYDFIDDVIDKYNEYFTKSVWDLISDKHRMNEDFIRKYKDKLNWNYITLQLGRNFSTDFILEMKDYIPNIRVMVEDIFGYTCNLGDHIKSYVADHFEEVLSYKGKDVK